MIGTSSRMSIDRDRGGISYAFDPYDPGRNILVNRVIQGRLRRSNRDFSKSERKLGVATSVGTRDSNPRLPRHPIS